jgi:YggT family protein
MFILIHIVQVVFQIYTLMLFARILSSWLPQLNDYKITQFIFFYTDPYLNFFRRFIPPLGMIDFSPIIAFLCLNILQNIVLNLIVGIFG